MAFKTLVSEPVKGDYCDKCGIDNLVLLALQWTGREGKSLIMLCKLCWEKVSQKWEKEKING